MSKGRDAGEFGRINRVPMSLEVLDDGLHIGGVPEGDDVEHEAEGTELFLLPFPVACGELAATAARARFSLRAPGTLRFLQTAQAWAAEVMRSDGQ